MGQFTRERSEEIKQCVLSCNIQRFTVSETQAYIKQALSISLSPKSIVNYRARIRNSAEKWISKLARSKRGDYMAQHRERIDEVIAIQKMLWQTVREPTCGPRAKAEIAGKLLACTGQLIELYDSLPVLNALRDYGCGYDHDNHDLDSQKDLSGYSHHNHIDPETDNNRDYTGINPDDT